jgi:hypothetical protein
MKAAFWVIGLIAALGAGQVSAGCYSTFDYRSNTYYTVCDNPSFVTIQGNNFNNGSNWNERQNHNGTYNGTDSKGNFYQGDNNTGYYQNLGTGRMCTGKGVGRICN